MSMTSRNVKVSSSIKHLFSVGSLKIVLIRRQMQTTMKPYAKHAKIIANSGYGFWGLRTKNRDSVVMSKVGASDFYQYVSEGKLVNYRDEGEYCIMRVEKDLEIEDFNVSIASAISSYARIRLWQLITEVEKKGCKVFYCDTDSIITDCDLSKYDDLMNEFCWDKTGDELGSLKNEAEDKLKKYNKKAQAPVDIVALKQDGDICFDELL